MTTATAEKKPVKGPSDTTPKPPAPEFWRTYSPHGEFPLSAAGSFALHLMVIGGLVITTVYFAHLLFKPVTKVPVEAVRLLDSGGGGAKGATGDGTGTGARVEDTRPDKTPDNTEMTKDAPPITPLNEITKKELKQNFDEDSYRILKDPKTSSAEAFANLPDMIRRKLSDGIARSGGKGGTGSGSGEGTGTGTGTGSGTKEGKQATLTQREKRMLRWTMKFTANNGKEYVDQMRALGAILAIPVVENPEPQYEVVRDLRPGHAKLQKEDLSAINRIYWIDSNPSSIVDVLGYLRIRARPTRFVAFMPQELENKLFDMEKQAMESQYGSYNEDKIEETIFRVVRSPGGGYTAQFTSIKFKR